MPIQSLHKGLSKGRVHFQKYHLCSNIAVIILVIQNFEFKTKDDKKYSMSFDPN
jgi:hypothetical protein